MEYIRITVPNMNDSVSRIVLRNKAYFIRFTWNEEGQHWKFGIYDSLQNPIVIGMKIVPNFPLNLYHQYTELPNGLFVALCRSKKIGRYDFLNEKCSFLFLET